MNWQLVFKGPIFLFFHVVKNFRLVFKVPVPTKARLEMQYAIFIQTLCILMLEAVRV